MVSAPAPRPPAGASRGVEPLRLSGIAGTRVQPGGEVADPVNDVLGKEGIGQLPQIQPPERAVLQSAVVEIEAVYIEVRDQSLLPYKDRDRLGGRSRPYRRRDRGGIGTLPRSVGGRQRLVVSAASRRSLRRPHQGDERTVQLCSGLGCDSSLVSATSVPSRWDMTGQLHSNLAHSPYRDPASSPCTTSGPLGYYCRTTKL